jgi:hypothetical protein
MTVDAVMAIAAARCWLRITDVNSVRWSAPRYAYVRRNRPICDATDQGVTIISLLEPGNQIRSIPSGQLCQRITSKVVRGGVTRSLRIASLRSLLFLTERNRKRHIPLNLSMGRLIKLHEGWLKHTYSQSFWRETPHAPIHPQRV